MGRRLLFDIEGDGLLHQMTRIHCLFIEDIDTGERWDFANNAERNDIEVGLKMLEEAAMLIGHNIVAFDLPAILIPYPNFRTEAVLRDTLVMVRMMFANVKESDFRLNAKGLLPGQQIGRQGLKAWGYRLKLHKGDYADVYEQKLKDKHKEAEIDPPTKDEIRIFVWGTWNIDMHDYCGMDLDVNLALLDRLIELEWDQHSTKFEHQVHGLMVKMEENGFPFSTARALALSEKLRVEHDKLTLEAIEEIGIWWRPTKYSDDEDKLNRDMGEGDRRRIWGKIDIPKRNANFAKSNALLAKEQTYNLMRHNTIKGAPFVKVTLKEFNPGSRTQVIDRLTVLYEWTPQDFTDKGNPIVDDEILRNLAEHVPIADTLAEIFFLKKRLGMIADGKNAWLKLVGDDGAIHATTNCGGTVSGRASHARPNISQVPGVLTGDTKDKIKAISAASRLGLHISDFKFNPVKEEWSWVEKGREGKYGWEARECFISREGRRLMGCDLSGIEFRCLANLTFPFDNGELVDIVLNGDIHQKNADLAGISRSIAKRLLYACMYGGGDGKLGSIVEPLASEARQRTLGKQLRAKLMAAMPSLARAIKEIQREARRSRGTIMGLDGRRLYVRSPHSALNLRLQSDGAMIAKKWILLTDDAFYDEGWEHGPEFDYAFAAWSHDEIQVEVKEALAGRGGVIAKNMAPLAGEYFKFNCPVAAEYKIGTNWAETH